MPTETGLSLFGILKQADPALVDPGVTAQLECLLDDVVVGTQEMVGAIDAVCDVALRIIDKLKQGAAAGGLPLLGTAAGTDTAAYPPTPAMKRFADSLVGQRGIKPPPGYKPSISAESSLTNTRPIKQTVKRPGRMNPNRSVRHSCCTLKRLRRGKGSLFPTRPRPTRLRCRLGSIRTEAASAAGAVRPSSRQRDWLRLNRRRRRREVRNAKVTQLSLQRLPRAQIR